MECSFKYTKVESYPLIFWSNILNQSTDDMKPPTIEPVDSFWNVPVSCFTRWFMSRLSLETSQWRCPLSCGFFTFLAEAFITLLLFCDLHVGSLSSFTSDQYLWFSLDLFLETLLIILFRRHLLSSDNWLETVIQN